MLYNTSTRYCSIVIQLKFLTNYNLKSVVSICIQLLESILCINAFRYNYSFKTFGVLYTNQSSTFTNLAPAQYDWVERVCEDQVDLHLQRLVVYNLKQVCVGLAHTSLIKSDRVCGCYMPRGFNGGEHIRKTSHITRVQLSVCCHGL